MKNKESKKIQWISPLMIAAGVATIAVLAVVDQLIKRAVVDHLSFREPVEAIKGLLNWTYTTNTGGGFSILSGKTGLLVAATAVIMAALFAAYCAGWLQNAFGKISALLIVGGGIGNMIDRLFNGGKVIDFIDISPLFSFPIFNFADCCVTIGGIMFCIYIIFMHKFEGEESAAGGKIAEGEKDA